MAPPRSRRPGHSRRAQYGIFTGYVVAGLGLLLGALLLALSLWRPDSFSGPRSVAGDVVAPVGEAGAEVRNSGNSLWETISGYFRAGSQNAQLREELEIARIRLAEAEATKQENARLRGILGFAETEQEPIANARLIGSTASSTRRFAYLGAGESDGVRPGMPVRGPKGIVGRVLETGSTTSRVLLLSDSESVLPVRLADKDVIAFAEGRGDGLLNVRLINLGVNPIEVGDVFVTSGAGGYYAPGIAVAIATEVTADGAVARMISDPAGTDYVAVEPIWQPEAVEASLTPVEEELGEDEAVDSDEAPPE